MVIIVILTIGAHVCVCVCACVHVICIRCRSIQHTWIADGDGDGDGKGSEVAGHLHAGKPGIYRLQMRMEMDAWIGLGVRFEIPSHTYTHIHPLCVPPHVLTHTCQMHTSRHTLHMYMSRGKCRQAKRGGVRTGGRKERSTVPRMRIHLGQAGRWDVLPSLTSQPASRSASNNKSAMSVSSPAGEGECKCECECECIMVIGALVHC